MDIKKDFSSYLKSKGINSVKANLNIKRSIQNNSSQIFSDDYLSNNIFDKLLNERIIFLGEIEEYNTEVIKANLLYLDHISNEDITIYINSGGGSVYSGLGLLDVIEYIGSDVSTINTGLAASMAAVILCCGKKGKRKALKRSRTMIHQPIGYGAGWSQASDMEIEAKQMNDLKKELYEIISKKTGQNYKKVYMDGDRDYWMNSDTAKDYGMIDHIIKKK